MKRLKAITLLFLFAAGLLLFMGCAAPPSEKIIRETVRKHFGERQYRVKDIVIGKIERLPIRNRKYMGKEGYTIEIKSITMEIEKDVPAFNYKKGQFVIFSNGIIQIRKKQDQTGAWEISEISGIPVI